MKKKTANYIALVLSVFILFLSIVFVVNNVQFQFMDIIKYAILYSIISFLLFSVEVKYNRKEPLYHTGYYCCFPVSKKQVIFKSIYKLLTNIPIQIFHAISLSFVFLFYNGVLWDKILLLLGFVWMVMNSVFLTVVFKDISSLIASVSHSLYVQIYMLTGLSGLIALNSNEKLADYFLYFPIGGTYCLVKDTIFLQVFLNLLVSVLLVIYVNKSRWSFL